MKNLLDPEQSDVLESLASGQLLLGFDFDGTLAPLVTQPDAAQMSETTAGLLSLVAQRYPVVVVSGRARADLLKRLRATSVAETIGNHGLEPWRHADQFVDRVQSWDARLGRSLSTLEGVRIENKVYSLAIHYRQAPDWAFAERRLRELAAELTDARVIGGHAVVNLVPVGAPNKGDAVLAAKDRLLCEHVLFVGDDDTDEDAFAQQGLITGVRVGWASSSRALYYLADQSKLDRFLRILLALRGHGDEKGRLSS